MLARICTHAQFCVYICMHQMMWQTWRLRHSHEFNVQTLDHQRYHAARVGAQQVLSCKVRSLAKNSCMCVTKSHRKYSHYWIWEYLDDVNIEGYVEVASFFVCALTRSCWVKMCALYCGKMCEATGATARLVWWRVNDTAHSNAAWIFGHTHTWPKACMYNWSESWLDLLHTLPFVRRWKCWKNYKAWSTKEWMKWVT